jgi:hypothetical protein
MSDDHEGGGYGKPPKKYQFQKGQSGNPKGRKKGARGLKTDLQAELVSTMTIQMNGKQVTATKQRLMLKTLTARAAAGDTRAAEKLVDIIAKIVGVEDRNADNKRLSPQDDALLEQFLDTRAGQPNIADPEDEDEDDSDLDDDEGDAANDAENDNDD